MERGHRRLTIRPAEPREAAALSELALRARGHWGYAAEVLESWRGELSVAASDVEARATHAAVLEDALVGFYTLEHRDGRWELDNLWVSPDFMRQGIGRALLAHALDRAFSSGATEVAVDSDPFAEAFYLACGAVRRGEVAAAIPGDPGRVRPQLAFTRPIAAG